MRWIIKLDEHELDLRAGEALAHSYAGFTQHIPRRDLTFDHIAALLQDGVIELAPIRLTSPTAGALVQPAALALPRAFRFPLVRHRG